jgi:hypothetical protein
MVSRAYDYAVEQLRTPIVCPYHPSAGGVIVVSVFQLNIAKNIIKILLTSTTNVLK